MRKSKPESRGKKVNSLRQFRSLKIKGKDSDKKTLIIRDISKVLTEIEESKKSKKIIYFSELYKKRVMDSRKKSIGALNDLSISGGEKFPEVSHIVILHKGKRIMIPWKHVEEFNNFIRLNTTFDRLDKREVRDDDIFLGQHILDMQVVDVNGLKVVRVNDIALTYIKNKLAVVDIDVGTRAIMRRLGLKKIINWMPSVFKDRPVPWSSIEPLTKSLEKIHLKVPCPRVSDLHPADVAELFDELSTIERKIIIRSMKSKTAARVILECEPEVQKSVINSLVKKRVAKILENMPPNDAANLISYFNNDKIKSVLGKMQGSNAIRIQEMLAYKPETIARYMSESFFTVNAELSVEEIINIIRNLLSPPENFNYIYVVDENNSLKGVLSLKQLLMADQKTLIKDIMVQKVIALDINYPIEYVERVATKYDLVSLPVVDINNKLRGVINIVEILDLVVERTKSKEPFQLSDQEKDALEKDSRKKKANAHIIKDVGQFVKDFDKDKNNKGKLKNK